MTIYKYTKDKIDQIREKTSTKSALNYPLLEVGDHEMLKKAIENKIEERKKHPEEGDINASYQPFDRSKDASIR